MLSSDPAKSERIRQYWGERASTTDPSSRQATTYDVFLREHEIATLRGRIAGLALPPGARVLDVGCGDGYATVKLAAHFPHLRFIGVDWSEEMLRRAERALAAEPAARGAASFRVGDMRALDASLGAERFDVCLSMRSLINLTSAEEQYATLAQIAAHLGGGGHYFCIENFMQGQRNFNRLRVAMGLPEIPVRWHNHFFEEEVFVKEAGRFFDSIEFDSFLSSYYLATRVIYSAGCQLAGEEPDYFHPIHQVAARLPVIGDFCPIKLVTLRRRG